MRLVWANEHLLIIEIIYLSSNEDIFGKVVKCVVGEHRYTAMRFVGGLF
jgi:hypothetical protein